MVSPWPRQTASGVQKMALGPVFDAIESVAPLSAAARSRDRSSHRSGRGATIHFLTTESRPSQSLLLAVVCRSGTTARRLDAFVLSGGSRGRPRCLLCHARF